MLAGLLGKPVDLLPLNGRARQHGAVLSRDTPDSQNRGCIAHGSRIEWSVFEASTSFRPTFDLAVRSILRLQVEKSGHIRALCIAELKLDGSHLISYLKGDVEHWPRVI